MSELANRFIEQYVDLLETEEGKVEFFKHVADTYAVSAYDAAIISNKLELAGIDIAKEREHALHEFIYSQFWKYTHYTVGKPLSLIDFVNINIKNRIGYSLDFVLSYIIKHYKDWSNVITIYEENELLFVRGLR